MNNEKKYKLIGADGKEYLSEQKGTLGGHRKLKIYGRLDCPSALRHIAKGHYVHERVFFSDEATAIAAGYRPCAVCMKKEYQICQIRTKTMDYGVIYARSKQYLLFTTILIRIYICIARTVVMSNVR